MSEIRRGCNPFLPGAIWYEKRTGVAWRVKRVISRTTVDGEADHMYALASYQYRGGRLGQYLRSETKDDLTREYFYCGRIKL